jgi:hypothetical protein
MKIQSNAVRREVEIMKEEQEVKRGLSIFGKLRLLFFVLVSILTINK